MGRFVGFRLAAFIRKFVPPGVSSVLHKRRSLGVDLVVLRLCYLSAVRLSLD